MSNSPIERLLTIMAQLRDKETGCPWDVEQNFASIAPYALEEAYEVVDAIAENDMDGLREELGDLLLQVVFHAQMAKEEGLFDFDAVAEAVSEKLVRRHPHVFGDKARGSAADVTETWDAIKETERKGKAKENPSLLDNIPRALPALSRALKIQKRAAKVGFDWDNPEPVFNKLTEEVAELRAEMAKNAPKMALTDELGDILFVCVNLARQLDVDPEEALRGTNRKFERRFHHIEQALAAKGRSAEEATLEEMDVLWNEAKIREKERA